ncbi:type II toxin-antitoxin system VapC family toxin [Thermus thermophilus]|uniref:type II toxin-antitoxin system VapC family toxin n=1 Tax=Thermus thermophilus TaxID=274 RepID=UPI001FCBB800|nr:PIN domain-containing protein [Thermus thermophilus]BDG21378.1 twitching motility protein PilT [Thermus thermophilus]BDG23917.1 twitching motility protein PilT [Thermus thermophilus]BDG28817.1 twitching motility protein PilT [Thermus thermophilus]
MAVFLDTSALYALLDRDDAHHQEAARTFRELLEARWPLKTHAYVVVESVALVQRRLGVEAVRVLVHDLMGVVEVAPVEEALHRAALTALLASGRREVSLVDWTSFLFMRERRLEKAFAYDEHFWEQGFVPAGEALHNG